MQSCQTASLSGGPAEPGSGSQAPSRRILLVDDQPFFLTMGQHILCGGGYEVLTAPSGREALKLARATPPDAILLDVEMPEMNGFETCRRLKADPRTAPIPVAMLTATLDPQLNQKAFQVGAEATILKAVSAGRLLNMLQVVLTTTRGRRTALRAGIALAVEYEEAGRVASGETLNISADGMYIKTPSPVVVGAILLVRFALPGGQRWQCSARVAWARRPGDQNPYPLGMGVQFLDLPTEARTVIINFVAAEATPVKSGVR